MMTKRVKEILSHYPGENDGVLTNLARLLMSGRLGGTGKLVILPVDQGFEHGPARSFAVNPPAYNPLYHFQLAIAAGGNGEAARGGFVQVGPRQDAGELPRVLKLNKHDLLYDDPNPISAVTGSVNDALR